MDYHGRLLLRMRMKRDTTIELKNDDIMIPGQNDNLV